MANDTHRREPQETDRLLNHPVDIHTRTSKNGTNTLLHHLENEISTRHTDLILLYCYIITGLLDSSAVFIWGSFVSMQTGNTVYLGLGLSAVAQQADNIDNRWIKSGVSIASFCLGSLLFGLFHRAFSARRRWVLATSVAAQMLCIVCAATIVTTERPSKDSKLTWRVIVPLAMVAFQSSGQAVMSRVLKLGGLSSVVLTSVYCDLFSHPDFLSPSAFVGSLEERRRVGAVVFLLLGAIVGGTWANSSVGLMGALWTAVILKTFIIVTWLVWSEDKSDDDGEVQA